ncbi:MAG: T9SS type A sorting domain-containing protein [Bacteroidales bacterium]
MKKIAFIIAVSLFALTTSKAQISLEHEFSWMSAASVNLPTLGYKYYAMDAYNNKCIIYNTNYSIYKQVSIPVPAGYYLVDLQYLTENLFNTDSKLEFLYVIYKYDSTLGYGMYSTRVMSEDGAQLLQVDGGGYSVVYPAAQGSKLFVWMYDFSLSVYSTATRVYSLPGSYIAGSGIPGDDINPAMQAWPNPAREFILLPIPENAYGTPLSVSLVAPDGKKIPISNFRVENQLINLPTSGIAPGTYFYRISNGSRILNSGKIIITQ